MKLFCRLHLVVGIVVFAIFLGTGLYMRSSFPDLYQPNEVIRYQMRANHVYILCASLLNALLGCYLKHSPKRWGQNLQLIGSLLIIAATIILIWAFFNEPMKASPFRPVTLIGMFALLFGTIAHMAGGFNSHTPTHDKPPTRHTKRQAHHA